MTCVKVEVALLVSPPWLEKAVDRNGGRAEPARDLSVIFPYKISPPFAQAIGVFNENIEKSKASQLFSLLSI